MKHVKFKYPDLADDYRVHFLRDEEWTPCGLAYKGVENSYGKNEQGFVLTNERVACIFSKLIVQLCRQVKDSEMDGIKKHGFEHSFFVYRHKERSKEKANDENR